jgi:release factor glutamine methyltransferase
MGIQNSEFRIQNAELPNPAFRIPHSALGLPTHAERLAAAAERLSHVTETPRLDAEILLAHALDISRSALLARLRERAEAPAFDEMLERRMASEPIAYVLREWEFFSLRLEVRPPLLVPRPETEHLVEAVLDFVGKEPSDVGAELFRTYQVLEIGTGTGCVAVAIAHNAPNAMIVATDTNPVALETAGENARRHGVADRVTLRLGDLFDAIERTDAPFDVVCSNPPYVEEGEWKTLPPVIRLYEDPAALVAGPDGLDVIRRIVREAPSFLKPDGMLAFEIGAGQRDAVEHLLEERGYHAIHFRPDLAGIPRIAVAQ